MLKSRVLLILNILPFNIRSLNKNLDYFKTFLDQLSFEFSVIGLCETWLVDGIYPLHLLNNYSYTGNSRVGKSGGGVGIYTSNIFQTKVLEELNHMSSVAETVFIELILPEKKNIIIGEIYKPPQANPNDFLAILENILSAPSLENKTCFIMGDFNLDLLKCNSCIHCQSFCDIMLAKSFVHLINRPTRIANNSSTLIDNIFTNSLELTNSGIIISDISDHFPVYVFAPITMPTVSSSPALTRIFSDNNISKLKESLVQTDWSQVYNKDNANEAFNVFINLFMNLFNTHFPLQSSRTKYKKVPRSPWITNSLLRPINRKNRLYYKKTKSERNKQKYSNYRNILTSLLRIAKRNFFSNQFEIHKSDAKSTWKVITIMC